MKPQLLFFIGKGGVGKSTTSAITAVHLSRSGLDTLLVSMDPAHNQRDIFDINFSEKPKPIASHLCAKEVDTDYWTKKYLKATEDHIKSTYTYQSAFNIQHYFKVLKYSPGLEEYALLLSFEDTIRTHKDKDVIVFDMAPTALTLRFFSLPFISLIWMNELLKLRKTMYEKKEIISKIKIGNKEFERDKVQSKLEVLIHNYEHLRDLFLSDATHINLVVNDDRLSFSEAIRIKHKLSEVGIHLRQIVVNKSQHDEIPESIITEFPHQTIEMFPYSPQHIVGLETIVAYIDAHKQIFSPRIA
jgi:arsenite-transporting ATPase